MKICNFKPNTVVLYENTWNIEKKTLPYKNHIKDVLILIERSCSSLNNWIRSENEKPTPKVLLHKYYLALFLNFLKNEIEQDIIFRW